MLLEIVQKLNIVKHYSLIILLAGAGFLYLLNVVLYFYLSSSEYAKYGLISSYIAIVTVFSGFGFDQILTRYSLLNEGKVSLPKNSIIPSLFLVIFSSLIFSGLFSILFMNGNFLSYFFISVLSGASLYFFTVFRLNSMFVAAQIQKNLWKMFIPIGVYLYALYFVLDAEVIVNFIFLLMLITVILGFFQLNSVKVQFFVGGNYDWRLLFGYFFSMVIMNFLSSSDRFVVEYKIGSDELAKYFFLQNIFLFPLTQLQNYFGFKDVVHFKNKITSRIVLRKIFVNLTISLVVSFVILALFFMIIYGDYFDLDKSFDYFLIFLLLCLGIVRVLYSSLSAAVSVVADYKAINYLNILSVFVVSSGAVYLHVSSDLVLREVVFIYILYWLFRAISYHQYLRRHLDEV